MMINVIFNDFSYEIVPKQLETFEKYTKILQWGRRNPTRFLEDFMNLQFTDHQKYVLLSSWIPQNVVWLLSRSSGKALDLNTKIWVFEENCIKEKILKDIKVGDKIFGNNGEITTVVELKPIIFDDAYQVEFADGENVICNKEHLWKIKDTRGFSYNTRPFKLVETGEMIGQENAIPNGAKWKRESFRTRFFVPRHEALKFPNQENNLLISPYLLGRWLGDGHSVDCSISCSGEDLEETLKLLKPFGDTISIEPVSKKQDNNCFNIFIDRQKDLREKYGISWREAIDKSLVSKLKQLNLYNNKHIPMDYLTASIKDRMELLQGYCDSDGCVSKNGHVSFVVSTKYGNLANDLELLLKTLGIKHTKKLERTYYIKKSGEEAYAWSFTYSISKNNSCFKLNRKYERLREKTPNGSVSKGIIKITKLNKKIPMRCISVDNEDGTFLIGDNMTTTHNSFMTAPFIMARSLLIPSHNTYIMAPSGGQAQETFEKMEQLAKDNIASVIGVSSFFLDETIRANSKADPFVHDKNSYHVSLYNGSTVNTLNSVATNIVGIRSNFNIYDEAGKINREFYALTQPFTVQNTDFVVGKGINTDIYPKQLRNKTLYLSSAEGVDSELYDQYKLSFQKMLMGDPEYFVADLNCDLSLHPFINGKPAPPLVTQDVIDNAFKTNPYRATRE